MTLTINPAMEKFIEEQVRSGNFRSPDEVLEAGLARLMLDAQPEELSDQQLADLNIAFDQVDRGETVDGEKFHTYLRRKYLVQKP